MTTCPNCAIRDGYHAVDCPDAPELAEPVRLTADRARELGAEVSERDTQFWLLRPLGKHCPSV